MSSPTSATGRFGALPKFSLGTAVFTRGVIDSLPAEETNAALRRHAQGDWGDCSPEDAAANEEALKLGLRLLSVYRGSAGREFWIITEADRSATTVLLPEEY